MTAIPVEVLARLDRLGEQVNARLDVMSTQFNDRLDEMSAARTVEREEMDGRVEKLEDDALTRNDRWRLAQSVARCTGGAIGSLAALTAIVAAVAGLWSL